MSVKKESIALFSSLQETICSALEQQDGTARFNGDTWERTDTSGSHGGGGDTRVLKAGAVFEQAGVNISEVHGTLPKEMSFKLMERDAELPFFATGISLVLHPCSPMVPTTHANFRYLEVDDAAWFGGGMDLTPYYLFDEDAVHFHSVIKQSCDRHDRAYYPRFKQWCDTYFYLPHRNETRGVGGLFFDYLGKDLPLQGREQALRPLFSFVKDISAAFLDAYLPIVARRAGSPFTESHRQFQLLRRGRYVEFNLLYDRGTLFGLKTGGRTESILMSLPPLVRWDYNASYEPGSNEATLLEVLQHPRRWVEESD